MIEFNRGVGSCSGKLDILFKFLFNCTCRSSQVMIAATCLVLKKVNCKIWSYVQMDKVSTITSYLFLIMLNNLLAATFRRCVLFESKIVRGGFIISCLLKLHVMNYNNFACEVLGGDSLELRGMAWWGVTLSLIQIYRNNYQKKKRKPGARRKERFQLISEECILM